jgi:hypothetical protein
VTGRVPATERIVSGLPDRSINFIPFLQLILPSHRFSRLPAPVPNFLVLFVDDAEAQRNLQPPA